MRACARDVPLVPAASIAGRALVTVIAIMTFLAGAHGGHRHAVADAADGWRGAVAREMTIQVRPVTGRDIDADVARPPQCRARHARHRRRPCLSARRESEALLDALARHGSRSLANCRCRGSSSSSSIPRRRPMSDALRKTADGQGAERDARRSPALAASGSSHHGRHGGRHRASSSSRSSWRRWRWRSASRRAARWRATARSSRCCIFVGAADGYIARQFQRHFFRLGLRGGLIGGGAAILVFLLSSSISALMRSTAGGDQLQAMFGSFALSAKGYGVIALIACGIAVTTGLVSRLIVFRRLRELL